VKPKISIVSLAVADLDRAVAFYRDGLGFPTHNYSPGDDYILFRLDGAWLSLMQHDATPASTGLSTVGLSHNVASEAEVDAIFAEGLAAGASPVTAPRKAPWGGYEAGFADPDGHVWDIAYNPFTDLT
jgi:uncharacterized glyoxalase superfamily protein PhnB